MGYKVIPLLSDFLCYIGRVLDGRIAQDSLLT
nr:MAG TPA: hypothetical protein [Caudoviricetes sp.]